MSLPRSLDISLPSVFLVCHEYRRVIAYHEVQSILVGPTFAQPTPETTNVWHLEVRSGESKQGQLVEYTRGRLIGESISPLHEFARALVLVLTYPS